jgi:ferric-dicitrate binding protein FerR (iron transport regulator)
MPSIRLEYLFRQYLNQELSADENRELMQLLQQQSNDAAVKEWLDDLWSNLTIENRLSESKANALFNAILAADRGMSMQTAQRPVRRMFTTMRVAAAAVLLLCISAGAWYFFFKKPAASTVQRDEPAHIINDLPPGTNNAVLVLADGSRINLDSTANGNLARQGEVTISKRDGMVVYDNRQQAIDNTQKAIPYNTISTARGNQYQLLLPDGSKVWLNAESSVRFPVAFHGKERRVEITGEVFFDVVHNSKMPFAVVANGVEVQDLGTQFNVNAYKNEEGVKTTVVEGKVNIQLAIGNKQKTIDNRQSAILVPGQQAQVNDRGAIKVIKDADVDAAVAWKNGQFMFAGNSIQSVMRQLERWYDIEVSYAPNVSTEEYIGTITRFSNISAVLNMLERTGTVRFELKGKKVFVK